MMAVITYADMLTFTLMSGSEPPDATDKPGLRLLRESIFPRFSIAEAAKRLEVSTRTIIRYEAPDANLQSAGARRYRELLELVKEEKARQSTAAVRTFVEKSEGRPAAAVLHELEGLMNALPDDDVGDAVQLFLDVQQELNGKHDPVRVLERAAHITLRAFRKRLSP